MRLVITVGGVDVEFTQPGASGEYPWLVKVGTLLLAVRAGHLDGVGVGESANCTFELDNINRQAADLLGYCPRAPAVIYDAAGDVWFRGLLQQMTFGTRLTGAIEA